MVRLVPRLSAYLVIALMAGPVLAQTAAPTPTASHLALARELQEIQGALSPADGLLPQLTEQIRRSNLTRPEITKDLNEVLTALKPELELLRQQMVEAGARVYARNLTEADLREALTFYKSPVGQRMIKAQPEIVEGVTAALQAWAQQASEYIMVRTRAEMGKRGIQMQ